MKKSLLLVLFLLLLAPICLPAQENPGRKTPPPEPQWNTNGLEINNSTGNTPQQNPKILSSSNGELFVIWEDDRFGFTSLYAQKMDGGGTRYWGAGGVPVCTANGNQNTADLISDGNGGLIVVWQDFRGGEADIYIQHLNSRGELTWGSSGAPVCQASAGQFSPQLIADGLGGAIVAWHDYRSGKGEDLYAQRINSSGVSVWKQDGVPVCLADGTQWYPKITSDGSGGAIIAWTDGRSGATNNNIFAQRIDYAGKPLWGNDGVAICTASGNQERPEIITARRGAYIAWEDSRSGNIDLYAQAIDLDGNSLWPKDGVPVVAAPFSQQRSKLALGPDGSLAAAWVDNRDEESAIYVQRLSENGFPLWGVGGRLVSKCSAKEDYPLIVQLKTSGWFVVWQDYREKVSLLIGQRINENGIPTLPAGDIVLSPYRGGQEKADIALSQNGNIFVVWQDRRDGNYDIFGQKLSPDGLVMWGDSGLLICNVPGSVIHQNPNLVNGGNGETIVVFEDARSGYLNIYAQKINRAGTLLWGKNGLALGRVKGSQANPQVIGDGAGGAIVVWEDGRDPDYTKIYARRITAGGKLLWAKSLPLTKIDSRQSHPIIVSDDSGGAIIVWEDDRSPLGLKDLYGQRISGNGEILWGKNGLPVCTENGDQAEAAITSDGQGGIVAVWTDYRQGDRNPDIYAQAFGAEGKAHWQKNGIIICGAPDVQRTPKVIRENDGTYFIAWADKGGGSYDIYAQLVDGNGRHFWLTDGIPACQSPRTQQNPVIAKPFFVGWEDYRFGNWDVFANLLSKEGKLSWGDDGSSAASLPSTQYALQVTPWQNNSAIFVWEDYRDGKQYAIYFQNLNVNGRPVWQENGVHIQTANGAREPKITALPEENAFLVVWEDYANGGKAIFGQRFTTD